jgi:hypothetical protein
MGEKIVSDNLDVFVGKNREIHTDLFQKALLVRTNWNRMQINSSNQLAMQILNMYGLIQIPLDNQYWSGAIFVKNERKIPVINTALPRANQYFTAWQEIYHLIFDQVLFSRIIDSEMLMEEIKAEYFASLMILGNVLPYYYELPNMDFISKIFYCMDMFKAPYKVILIALYEEAMQEGNQNLLELVKQNFDVKISDTGTRFHKLGLDDSLVRPSFVVNVTALKFKIQDRIKREPEMSCNYDNASFLENIIKEINLLK